MTDYHNYHQIPLVIRIWHRLFLASTGAIIVLLFLAGNRSAPEAGVSAPGVSSEARTVTTHAQGALSEAPGQQDSILWNRIK